MKNKNIIFYIQDKRWYKYTTLIKSTILNIIKYKNNFINVTLTNNDFIQNLNKNFRNSDKPTDILSFPLEINAHNNLLGDIIMSYDCLQEKRKIHKKTMKDYVKILSIHGTLHLLGYDHESDEDWIIMNNLENILYNTKN